MPVIDWNQARQQAANASFEPLQPGEYNLTCIESTPTESSNGKPMIKTKWQVEDGPSAGKKVFNQFVFSADNDNALAFFFQHMKFLGLDDEFFATQPSWETVASMIVGRRCRMLVDIREWNGSTRNDVKKIMPPLAPAAMPGMAAAPQMPVAAPAVQMPVAPVAQPVVQPPLGGVFPDVQVTAPAAVPVAPVAPPVAPVAPPVQPVAAPVDAPVAPQPAPVAVPVAPAAPVAPAFTPPPVAPVTMPPVAPVAPAPQQYGEFTVLPGSSEE